MGSFRIAYHIYPIALVVIYQIFCCFFVKVIHFKPCLCLALFYLYIVQLRSVSCFFNKNRPIRFDF